MAAAGKSSKAKPYKTYVAKQGELVQKWYLVDVAGQSLIALGLTFVIVGVALLLAGFEARMAGMMD